jgi:sortase A
MLLNPSHSRYAVLLVGLFLVTSGVGCASPTISAPEVTQPALPTSTTISTIPFAIKTLDGLESTPTSISPLATRTPQAVNPGPNDAGTALEIEVHGPVKESLVSAPSEEDRTPTRLVIKVIGLDAPVEPVGWHVETRNSRSVNVWNVPSHFAAGWLKTSAPFGVPGNTVLDGHHNIKDKVFENLINLRVGDIITVYASSMERVYRVEQKLVLKELGQPLDVIKANAQYIEPTTDERLTLVTCWPPTGNSYRLIIVALPAPLPPN